MQFSLFALFALCEVAAGMGIVGCRVTEPQELVTAVGEALASGSPRVIDVAIEPKL